MAVLNADTLYDLAEKVGLALSARDMMLATAESCTGGWIGQAVTMVAGSSRWYDRGFVVYSNEAKQDMLGVAGATLLRHGAVSEDVALEMAAGALRMSRAQAAVAVTGIAGPGGGSLQRPVGTVCFAWALEGGDARADTCHFVGDRDAVRRQAVRHALEGLLAALSGRAAEA